MLQAHLRISGGFMFNTLVIRPCMIRKWGLLTLSWTEWNKFCVTQPQATIQLTVF